MSEELKTEPQDIVQAPTGGGAAINVPIDTAFDIVYSIVYRT